MDIVPRSFWENYPINVDLSLARRVVSLLRDHGFEDVEEDPTFDWHDDTITPSRWMFPDGTPPATVVSLNARYNPVFHAKIGKALRALRGEGILLCGTGGAVHNLYRNNWLPLLTRGDNFQKGSKPAKWAIEFDKSVNDVVTNNSVGLFLWRRRMFLTSPGLTTCWIIDPLDIKSSLQGCTSNRRPLLSVDCHRWSCFRR